MPWWTHWHVSMLREKTFASWTLQLTQVDEEVALELYALIVATQSVGDEPEANQAGVAEDTVARPDVASDQAIPEIWEDLKPGMLVLAADLDRQGKPEAWYEAEIVSLEGPEIRLAWRDFPREGLLLRTRRHIAILHPAN